MNQKLVFVVVFLLSGFVESCQGQELKTSVIDSSTNMSDSVLTIWTYGMPNFERRNSENVIAKKWGIGFKPVAGCVVSGELVDSINKHNYVILLDIKNKYGQDWDERFEKEVDEEFEKQKNVLAVLDTLKYIDIQNKKINQTRELVRFYLTPIEGSDEYNIEVYGWENKGERNEKIVFYNLVVNHKTKSYRTVVQETKNKHG